MFRALFSESQHRLSREIAKASIGERNDTSMSDDEDNSKERSYGWLDEITNNTNNVHNNRLI